MTNQIKLKKISQKDRSRALKLGIRESTAEMLDQYKAHYKSVHGEEISQARLVDEILLAFMQDDKQFQKAIASK